MVTEVPPVATHAPSRAPGRRRPDLVTVLCVVVVAAAVVVRIVFAANQSYWTDEMFSVDESSGTLGHLYEVGRSEVHTPLYALLLWGWQHLGGSHTLWTRGLSVLFGLASILTAELALRPTGISVRARRLAVAVTAACGFGIVYAQEDRPYALVLLGATGLTAVTLTRLVTVRRDPARAGRRWLLWLAWALLTATAHLLGAVLVGVLALALAGATWRHGRVRGAARELGLGVVALLPQIAWIVVGTGRGGFAAGTSWIPAPTPADVWLLLRTVFSAGGLVPHADGFAWTSPFGVLAVVVLLAVAALLARRRFRAADDGRPAPAGDLEPDDARLDRRLAAVLLGVAAAALVATYAVSQVVHLWTLRNMIVVVPPLTWGTVWLASSLPATRAGRRAVSVAVLAASLLSLGAVADDLTRPYKTDWRGLVHYLERVRAEDPTTTFSVFGGKPSGAFTAADQRGSARALRRLDSRVDHHPRNVSAIPGLHRIAGPQVVYFYVGVGRPDQPVLRAQILAQLNDPTCKPVPIYGLVVVSCP